MRNIKKGLYVVTLLILISSAFASSSVSLNGLVSYWNFNSSLNLTDYTSRNNLVIYGTSTKWIATPFDYGYNQTGSYYGANGLYATDSTSLSVTSNLTIGIIIKINSLTSTGTMGIMSKRSNSKRSYFLGQDHATGTCAGNITFQVTNSTGSTYGSKCTNARLTADGSYHTLIARFTPFTVMEVYLDGVNKSVGSMTGGIPGSIVNNAARFGLLHIFTDIGNRSMNASIEEAWVFNRTLTPAEISAYHNNFTAGKGLIYVDEVSDSCGCTGSSDCAINMADHCNLTGIINGSTKYLSFYGGSAGDYCIINGTMDFKINSTSFNLSSGKTIYIGSNATVWLRAA